jgi:hypothetical protein
MKPLLLLAVLALALPVCAQNPSCPKSGDIVIGVKPVAGSFTCQKKDGTVWTIAYEDTEGGIITVTSDGPGGSFNWQQSVLWGSQPVHYAACAGDVCWKFKQYLVSLLGGKNLYLEGPFITAE